MVLSLSHFQKFRVYLLEQEKSMNILAYLLCHFLEIKDKPGNELSSHLSHCPDLVLQNNMGSVERCLTSFRRSQLSMPLDSGLHSLSSPHTYL